MQVASESSLDEQSITFLNNETNATATSKAQVIQSSENYNIVQDKPSNATAETKAQVANAIIKFTQSAAEKPKQIEKKVEAPVHLAKKEVKAVVASQPIQKSLAEKKPAQKKAKKVIVLNSEDLNDDELDGTDEYDDGNMTLKDQLLAAKDASEQYKLKLDETEQELARVKESI